MARPLQSAFCARVANAARAHATLAQSVERLSRKEQVDSSILSSGSVYQRYTTRRYKIQSLIFRQSSVSISELCTSSRFVVYECRWIYL